jgi:hypothetical protein
LARNQSIVSPDRRAGTLQFVADHACAAGVLIGEVQRAQRREKHREALGIGVHTPALGDAVPQLEQRDGGDADLLPAAEHVV